MAEKGKRGFAAMDPERQRQIASMGGKAAHQKGTAHEFTPEEAREAGRKGGQAAHERGRAHVFTPEEARQAGRKGGQNSHARRAAVHPREQAPTPAAPERQSDVGHPSQGPFQGPHPGPQAPHHIPVNHEQELGELAPYEPAERPGNPAEAG